MYFAKVDKWHMERIINLVAGVFSLAGIILGTYVNSYFYLLNFLVGINLVILSLTGFCILSNILYFLGIRPSCDNKSSHP
ncbi:MAG: DUF2892 domain-containing protein [Leptospiraceae bacterium]|nr:DUF2892 domain-containing protein [Leptospiraceae bacterium]MCP5511141.1 DUF2892 domain-containing protein [Leptospiraceae bacterium]